MCVTVQRPVESYNRIISGSKKAPRAGVVKENSFHQELAIAATVLAKYQPKSVAFTSTETRILKQGRESRSRVAAGALQECLLLWGPRDVREQKWSSA